MTSGAWTFRRTTADDVALLFRWLNEPGVVRWWEGDDVSTPEVVRADYVEDTTAEHHLALFDGEPVGWIQCYDLTTSPEFADWAAHGVGEGTGGIDYLVGEVGRRGEGRGSSMIAAFVDQIVFGRHPEWLRAAAAPYAANVASCRALVKAGFRFVADIPDPDDADGPSSLHVKERAASVV